MSHYSHLEGVEELSLIVAEVFDERKIPAARRSYQGQLEILASDAFISRLIAQNVRHPGLSHVFDELLVTDEGHELYVRECPQFSGRLFWEVTTAFPHAIPLGVARPHGRSYSPILNPPADFALAEGDHLVLLSASYDESMPLDDFAPQPVPQPIADSAGERRPLRRILILGWNHKVPALLREFAEYEQEQFAITVFSLFSIGERRDRLTRQGIDQERIRLEQLEGDYTALTELQRAEPASLEGSPEGGNRPGCEDPLPAERGGWRSAVESRQGAGLGFGGRGSTGDHGHLRIEMPTGKGRSA